MLAPSDTMLIGSPPRVRGTEPPSASIEYRVRITPACAGNSKRIFDGNRIGTDHPRVCGEQVDKLRQEGALEGSPPRVRGTDGVTAEAHTIEGITPACAGNRAAGRMEGINMRDHPRVCGEQFF